MKIRSVRSYLLSYAFPEPLQLAYRGGVRSLAKRDAMLVVVETAEGLRGYAPGPGLPSARDAINEIIGPFLKGRILSDPDALRIRFLERYGAGARVLRHYCAVEIALYDLLGKRKGVPVSELLGGRVRDHIRLYGSAGMHMPPADLAREAQAIAALGFTAYKMRSGMGPRQDLDAVRYVREAVGPDFDLMIDAHAWWQAGGEPSYLLNTVEQLMEDFAGHHIAWLEEPLPPKDHQGYRRLKEMESVPVASGEHEPDDAGYLDLIATESVDFVQMDLVLQGGYPTARRILPGIANSTMKFAFGCWGTALEVIAAAHLAVCWPELIVEWLEYPCYSTPSRAGMYPFPLASEVLQRPLQIDHGDLLVPTLPGLGVEIDESVIERYPWIPGPSDAGAPL